MSNWDRVAASTGIAAAVLIAVGFASSGASPSWTASGSTIAQNIATHHDSGLASVIIVGFGLMALIWFAATLGSVLRANGEDRLGSVVLAGAAVFVSIFAIAGVVRLTLFYGSAGGDPQLTKTLFQMQGLATTLAFLPLALMIFANAVATARSKILPGWYAGISGVATLLIVVGVGTVAQSGAFSPNGGYAFVALLALAIWLVVTSILLMRGHGAVRQAVPATA